MNLSGLDLTFIGFYLIITVAIAFYFKNSAKRSLQDFFLGGKNLPWYVAGISMVATTFAADTPLAVTELVAANGISGNWLWWNMLIGGMLTTFFFAKLWRRANVLTELEFIEVRYTGKAAAFLRGFKSIYLGLFINTLVIAWVNLALVSLLQVFFAIPNQLVIYYVAAAMFFAFFTSALGGLKAVAVTDIFQFAIAIGGSVLLAVLILRTPEVGGVAGLQEKLPASAFDFFPKIGQSENPGTTLGLSMGAFLAFGLVQWWASWYPGAEPGGGGYVAQRIMSTKDEKNAIWATLFFQIAHYAIRPWPWILVALATMVVYPELGVDDKKLGYVMAIKDFLPSGLRGLLLVAFLAAYMSTISTQLNWGASFLVNDLYKRFIYKPQKSISEEKMQKHYVLSSRLATLAIVFLSLWITTQIETITEVWHFLLECGAGLGLVLILRWYWWRINAWSEIAAMVVPFLVYGISKIGLGMNFPDSYFYTVGITTLAWIVITFLTPPEPIGFLNDFYKRVRPAGFWAPFAGKTVKNGSVWLFMSWFFGVIMVYAALFATGYVILNNWESAMHWLFAFLISGVMLFWSMNKSPI